MTPRELNERLAGWQWRREREMERTAWLAAAIINHSGHVRRPVSITQLLGRGNTHRLNDGERKMTAEEVEESKRELLARFGEE